MSEFPMRKTYLLAIAWFTAFAGGCSTQHNYSAPEVSVPTHYSRSLTEAGWSVAQPSDTRSHGAWWRVFDDEGLNQLEARLDVSNQTVRSAVARLELARAMVGYQSAGYAPVISAGVEPQRFRTSRNLVDRSLAGKTIPDYALGINASWEPDLFDRVRSATTEARANAQASQADLESVRLSVSSDLATDYFAVRSIDRQGELLDEAIRTYLASLDVVRQRVRDGAIDESAVAQAQVQLEDAQTQRRDLSIQRAQLEHAIATLIGVPAPSFSLPVRLGAPKVPYIPVGLPSSLLERRPDIAAAERRVAAANAQIGVARAAFYPDLTLSASLGLESTLFTPWLTAPSLFWSLGSQLAGTLFDGGRRSAALSSAGADYDEAVAQYRQTVLSAFQQVEDNLAALDGLASEAQSQTRASAAAERSLQLTTNRYRAGAVSYLEVAATQTIELGIARGAEQIGSRRVAMSVQLLKALGGGWDEASLLPESADLSQHPTDDAKRATAEIENVH